MTGPEHYREAERLLKKAVPGVDASLLTRAQVHATLALAAGVATGNEWRDIVRPAGTEATR
jgi:hypothetical protein